MENKEIPDVQGRDINGKKIDKVGIRETYGEVIFNSKVVPANFSLYVSLIKGKGIHMSRLPQVLLEHSPLMIDKHSLQNVLDVLQNKSGEFCEDYYIKTDFAYAREILSPVTKLKNIMLIPVKVKVNKKNGEYKHILEIIVPYTSLCPCCFLPGTPIFTNKGIINIEDLNTNSKYNTLENNKIIKSFKYPSKGKEYVSIKIIGNMPINCSTDHKILIKRNFKNRWIAAGKLQKKDFVLIPKLNIMKNTTFTKLKEYKKLNLKKSRDLQLPDKISITSEFAKLCGFFIAEGGVTNKKQTLILTLNKKEKEYLKFIKENIIKYFNIIPTIRENKIQNSVNIEIYSKALRQWFIDNFRIKNANFTSQVKVPDFILSNNDEEIIKSFICGWYAGDGSHCNYRKTQRIITVSKQAALELQLLCLKLQNFISITKCKAINSKALTKKGSKSLIQDQYNCILNQKILHCLGLINKKPKVINPKIKEDNKYFYVPFINKKNIKYKGFVYDLQINNIPQYNIPFIVHNSKEISKYSAHNQRSFATVTVELGKQDYFETIQNLIFAIERNVSCPIFNILKREDEKYVTEKAYEKPMFVEDISRAIADDLDNFLEYGNIQDYSVVVNHEESIHQHNAVAFLNAGKDLK